MQRIKRRRKALVLLAVMALLDGGVGAWAHSPGPTGIPIPNPADGRVHSCYQGALPIDRVVRVVLPAESCFLGLTIAGIPIIETGVDWPSTGVLTQVSESPPVPVTFPAAVALNFAVISCTPKQAIGVLFSSPHTAPVLLAGSTRGGTPTGTELTATFWNLTATAQSIQARALCVTSFTR